MERVSGLLGHGSIRVTERHYSPWVRARQEQLEADVIGSWEQSLSERVTQWVVSREGDPYLGRALIDGLSGFGVSVPVTVPRRRSMNEVHIWKSSKTPAVENNESIRRWRLSGSFLHARYNPKSCMPVIKQ